MPCQRNLGLPITREGTGKPCLFGRESRNRSGRQALSKRTNCLPDRQWNNFFGKCRRAQARVKITLRGRLGKEMPEATFAWCIDLIAPSELQQRWNFSASLARNDWVSQGLRSYIPQGRRMLRSRSLGGGRFLLQGDCKGMESINIKILGKAEQQAVQGITA